MTPRIAASLANLLWLMPVPRDGRAGCFGLTGAPVCAALGRHFPQLTANEDHPDGSLDFVAALSDEPITDSLIHRTARTLAPGGWALVTGRAARPIGEGLRLRRLAGARGLTELRVYRVADSLANPRAVVPDTVGTLRAHAGREYSHGKGGFLRRLAVRTGYVPRDYAGLVLVGKRR